MSQALELFSDEPANILPRPSLEGVSDAIPYRFDDFPTRLDSLDPAEIPSLDRKAMILLGSRGVEGAFMALDSWVRFPVRTAKSYEQAVQDEVNPRVLQVNQAARYIAKLRFRNVLKSDVLPFTEEHYLHFPLFRRYRQLAHHQPNEIVLFNQLETARISISAVKMNMAIRDPRPRTLERQAAVDAAAAARLAPVRRNAQRRQKNLIQREFPPESA